MIQAILVQELFEIHPKVLKKMPGQIIMALPKGFGCTEQGDIIAKIS